MRVKREIYVHVCDGCGYDLPQLDMMELKLIVKPKEGAKHTIPFHFHPLMPEHDCLRYWFNGTGVMESSLKTRDISDEVKELILKTTKYRSAA